MNTYDDLMNVCGTPTNAAIMLGFCKADASYEKKSDARSRVMNWKKNGLPKRDKKLNMKFKELSSLSGK